MLALLKNHPFSIEAFFDYSLVLTYALRTEELADRIPACLSLDMYQERWAFVAVAMVQVKQMRPAGFPKFMGRSFFLIGYRIFVQYVDERGRRLRGLYILKSETNSLKMRLLGNLFTDYNYTATEVEQIRGGDRLSLRVKESGLDLEVDTSDSSEHALPQGSPFTSWNAARRFAGPMPFTFSYKPKSESVLIIEGIRQNWKPKPVTVLRGGEISFNGLKLGANRLGSAFIVQNVPYRWAKGRLEKWSD